MFLYNKMTTEKDLQFLLEHHLVEVLEKDKILNGHVTFIKFDKHIRYFEYKSEGSYMYVIRHHPDFIDTCADLCCTSRFDSGLGEEKLWELYNKIPKKCVCIDGRDYPINIYTSQESLFRRGMELYCDKYYVLLDKLPELLSGKYHISYVLSRLKTFLTYVVGGDNIRTGWYGFTSYYTIDVDDEMLNLKYTDMQGNKHNFLNILRDNFEVLVEDCQMITDLTKGVLSEHWGFTGYTSWYKHKTNLLQNFLQCFAIYKYNRRMKLDAVLYAEYNNWKYRLYSDMCDILKSLKYNANFIKKYKVIKDIQDDFKIIHNFKIFSDLIPIEIKGEENGPIFKTSDNCVQWDYESKIQIMISPRLPKIDMSKILPSISKIELVVDDSESLSFSMEETKSTDESKRSLSESIKNIVWKSWCLFSSTPTCFVCNCEISKDNWHCSHILARSKGGPDTEDNLRPSCPTCNMKMGATHMYRYIIYKEFPSRDKLPRENPYVRDALIKHEINKRMFAILDKMKKDKRIKKGKCNELKKELLRDHGIGKETTKPYDLIVEYIMAISKL